MVGVSLVMNFLLVILKFSKRFISRNAVSFRIDTLLGEVFPTFINLPTSTLFFNFFLYSQEPSKPIVFFFFLQLTEGIKFFLSCIEVDVFVVHHLHPILRKGYISNERHQYRSEEHTSELQSLRHLV